MAESTTPDEGVTSEPRPASLIATMHIDPRQVHAVDLTDDNYGHDLVDLRLGDDHAMVSVLGSLEHLRSVLTAGLGQLDRVEVARQHAAEGAR